MRGGYSVGMCVLRRFNIMPLALLLLSGCVVIPVPSQEKTIVGQQFTSPVVDSIVPSLTTRADLLERLGKPYTTLDSPHILVYPWTTEGGGLFWVVGAGGSGAAGLVPLHYHHALLIALDETEHVTNVEITKRRPLDSLREHAYKWAQAKGLTGARQPAAFRLRRIPRGQSMLYVYRPGGIWDAPDIFTASVLMGGQLLTELRGNENAWVVLQPGNYSIAVSPDAKNPASVYAHQVAHIEVRTSADQATFLRVRIPYGTGDVTPRLTLPPETEALKELKSTVTSW